MKDYIKKRRSSLIRYLPIFLLLILFGCQEEAVQESPMEITEEATEPIKQELLSCPDCQDGNDCTTDYCSEGTGYACVHDEIAPCCGNGNCEVGEDFSICPAECPECIAAECQTSEFDYDSQTCISKDIVPCCGNGLCEVNETCADDCVACSTDRECYKSVFDYDLQKCVEKPMVPCCGNGICDRGEDCDNCDDCKCAKGLDLSDFPDFLHDGTKIVVGDQATSQDSLTASALTTDMYTEGVETEANLYSLFSSAAISGSDLIVLGRPCENSLWEEYQGIECESDNYFTKDTAMIKLIELGDRQVVYVAGYTPDDTEKAVKFLLTGLLAGPEVELDTSGSSAKKI